MRISDQTCVVAAALPGVQKLCRVIIRQADHGQDFTGFRVEGNHRPSKRRVALLAESVGMGDECFTGSLLQFLVYGEHQAVAGNRLHVADGLHRPAQSVHFYRDRAELAPELPLVNGFQPGFAHKIRTGVSWPNCCSSCSLTIPR